MPAILAQRVRWPQRLCHFRPTVLNVENWQTSAPGSPRKYGAGGGQDVSVLNGKNSGPSTGKLPALNPLEERFDLGGGTVLRGAGGIAATASARSRST